MIFTLKARLKRTFFVLLMLSASCSASAQESSPWPSDFFDFYKKFRSVVIAQNYAEINEMTFFPFKAFDLTETLDTIPRKKKLRLIGRDSFVKHQLAKYFLTQSGDIKSDTPIVENGITKQLVYLYKSNAELIAENDDPRSLKKLRPKSSGYEQKSGVVFISGMEFTKKKNAWCWSYASYMRDDNDKW